MHKIKAITTMVFVVLLPALVMPTFAQPPTFPPDKVLTGGALINIKNKN